MCKSLLLLRTSFFPRTLIIKKAIALYYPTISFGAAGEDIPVAATPAPARGGQRCLYRDDRSGGLYLERAGPSVDQLAK